MVNCAVGCWRLLYYITGGFWLSTTDLKWTVLVSKTNKAPYSFSSACCYRQKGKRVKLGSLPKITALSEIESTGNKTTFNFFLLKLTECNSEVKCAAFSSLVICPTLQFFSNGCITFGLFLQC